MKENKENTNIDKAEKNKTKAPISQQIKSLKISPWIAGGVIGFLAASLQLFASVTKPPAYGFCMACHVRDLIDTIVNTIFGTKLFTAPILNTAVTIPVLTVIGIVFGAFVAAILSKEFHLPKKESPLLLLKMFVLGMLVMTFALLLGACPIRTSLRTAHGDIVALVGLICIGIGAILATRFVLERKIKKEV